VVVLYGDVVGQRLIAAVELDHLSSPLPLLQRSVFFFFVF
jgi:hypothetical protein